VVVLLVALAAAGCRGQPEVPTPSPSMAAASPTPNPTPSPSPTPPPPDPVAGTVEVATTDTSRNARLGLAEDGDPARGAVARATEAVAAALDAHLDAAQAGRPDLALLRGRWLEAVDPAAAELLRSGLATPDNPVTAAAYRFDVHLEPDPTLVVADVRVGRRDGTDVAVELVLDVTTADPTLLLVGAGGAP
jgi:hypothetical protein